MRKIIFCSFLFLTTITATGQIFDELKNSLVSKYADTFGKTMGENRVYREGNEVFIDGFYYTQGLSGLFSIDYSLDINEFNRYLYYVCNNTDYSYIYVTIIRKSTEDKYGNKYPGEKITIGKIDTAESKRYKSFDYWVRDYDFLSMFNKDLEEYNEHIERQRRNKSSNFMMIKVYYPKSIKK